MPNKASSVSACVPDSDGHCSICADEGVVARVVSVDEGATARVLVGAEELIVALDLIDGARPGDRILIHLGFAIARLEDA